MNLCDQAAIPATLTAKTYKIVIYMIQLPERGTYFINTR